MLNLSQIDVLLAIGVIVAVIAIGGGVRGVYSVSAVSRRERTNQTTTTMPISSSRKGNKAGGPPHKRRKAA